MVKTILVDDDIHELLWNKQKELKDKKINITLSNLASVIIKYNVNNIPLYLEDDKQVGLDGVVRTKAERDRNCEINMRRIK